MDLSFTEFASTELNTTHGTAWTSAPSVPLCGVRLQGSSWLNGLAIQFDCILCAAALDFPSMDTYLISAGLSFLPDTQWIQDLDDCFIQPGFPLNSTLPALLYQLDFMRILRLYTTFSTLRHSPTLDHSTGFDICNLMLMLTTLHLATTLLSWTPRIHDRNARSNHRLYLSLSYLVCKRLLPLP
jgi:hypothetical protein